MPRQQTEPVFNYAETKRFRKKRLKYRAKRTAEPKTINTALTTRNYKHQLKEQLFSSPVASMSKLGNKIK
jgi:hypothetical protein